MYYRGNVGRIVTAIRLSSNMEVGVGILREAGEEEFKECPYIFRGSRGISYGCTIRGVAESNIDGLIEEDDISVLGPAIRVVLSEGS